MSAFALVEQDNQNKHRDDTATYVVHGGKPKQQGHEDGGAQRHTHMPNYGHDGSKHTEAHHGTHKQTCVLPPLLPFGKLKNEVDFVFFNARCVGHNNRGVQEAGKCRSHRTHQHNLDKAAMVCARLSE